MDVQDRIDPKMRTDAIKPPILEAQTTSSSSHESSLRSLPSVLAVLTLAGLTMPIVYLILDQRQVLREAHKLHVVDSSTMLFSQSRDGLVRITATAIRGSARLADFPGCHWHRIAKHNPYHENAPLSCGMAAIREVCSRSAIAAGGVQVTLRSILSEVASEAKHITIEFSTTLGIKTTLRNFIHSLHWATMEKQVLIQVDGSCFCPCT